MLAISLGDIVVQREGDKQGPAREWIMKEKVVGPGRGGCVKKKEAFDVVSKNSYNGFKLLLKLRTDWWK